MPPVSGRDRTEDWTFGGTWPFEPRWFDADGGRMHHVDEGPRDGTPVVMLHGNPAWSYLYRRFIPELTAAGHRAIAVDLLGFGRSDKPGDAAAYSVTRHAGRVGALLDSLDLRQVCLVVHDWAGPIGLPWAVAHPDRVARLMILNTFAPRLPGPMGKGLTLRMLRLRGTGELIAKLRGGLTEDFLLGAGTRRRERLDDDVKRAYRAPYPDPTSRTGVLAFPRQVPLSSDAPVAELTRETDDGLRRIFRDRPALLCWGMRDVLFGPEVLDMWRDTLPGAGMVRLDDAGHFVQEDAHERVIPELLAFLRTEGAG
ncbi:MAG: cis-3-alkyl-4-acyloxetan-2-one decarboxylase [Thermoleophilaceae bacterium]|jgi:haloalkane dehalogenase|nr:cis-3-alkyl-4-acyloxetan-2-one decarboxylase [Thermoleophilaceae bacterium]